MYWQFIKRKISNHTVVYRWKEKCDKYQDKAKINYLFKEKNSPLLFNFHPFDFFTYIKCCWLSIHDITHLGGGGIYQKWHYSISLFSKMGDMREGSAPNPNNLVSLNYTFLDIFVLLCKPNRSPIDLPWCVQLKFTSKTIIASDRPPADRPSMYDLPHKKGCKCHAAPLLFDSWRTIYALKIVDRCSFSFARTWHEFEWDQFVYFQIWLQMI